VGVRVGVRLRRGPVAVREDVTVPPGVRRDGRHHV